MENNVMLTVSKESLARLVAAFSPVSDQMTLYPHGDTLISTERNDARTFGLRALFSDFTAPTPVPRPFRFKTDILSKWLPNVTGNIALSIDERNVLRFRGDSGKTLEVPLIAFDPDPDIVRKVTEPAKFPLSLTVESKTLAEEVKNLGCVGDTFEVTFADPLVLAAFAGAVRTASPYQPKSAAIPDDLRGAVALFNYEYVRDAVSAFDGFETLALNWGKIVMAEGEAPRNGPLMIGGDSPKLKVTYGVSPRMK